MFVLGAFSTEIGKRDKNNDDEIKNKIQVPYRTVSVLRIGNVSDVILNFTF